MTVEYMISHLTRELADALFNVENAGGRVNKYFEMWITTFELFSSAFLLVFFDCFLVLPHNMHKQKDK